MSIDIISLIALTAAALWTVMTRSLLRSGIGLALTSALLAVVIFRLNAAYAAVFELSVCSGLISVLFISTISLTHPLTRAETLEHMKTRLKRFWYLPVIVVLVAVAFCIARLKFSVELPKAVAAEDARFILWNLRRLDVIGQVIILLAGAFGVALLFKKRD